MAKFKLILTGWELEASAHSITSEEYRKILNYQEENGFEDVHQMYNEIENLIVGYNRHEGNIFSVSRPFLLTDNTFIKILDENNNVVLSFALGEINHDYDKFDDLDIEAYNANPQFSQHAFIIYTADESKGALFGCDFESEVLPSISDFDYSTTCIGNPDDEIDLLEDLYFRGEIMEKNFDYTDTRGKASSTYIYTK